MLQQPAQAAIPASERAALITLYNATDGANWTNKDGWLGAVGTECDWFGVICFLPLSPEAHINYLDLSSNHLSGTIPTELGQLNQLQHLYLFSNQLIGTIPAELGQLSQLNQIILGNNQLSGTIPAELGQLSQLGDLDLGVNQLSGAIPAELGQLSQMYYLALMGNQLSGTIPAELGQLSQLRTLYLHVNQLSGAIPAELGQLSQMNNLALMGNQLSGTIPAELGQLSQLRSLYLDFNQLSGTIPAELGQLSQLNLLFLGGNQLSGTIPTELGKLSQLGYLGLDQNFLTNIAPEIAQLTGLDWIRVDENCLSELTLAPAVVTLLNEKNPGWQNSQRTSCTSLLPTITEFELTEGTIPDTGLRFTATLSEPLPGGYGVFVNFDNQQGGWFEVGQDGWHLALVDQGNGVYAVDYKLVKPGLRSFRAGIFKLNGAGDSDDTLVGGYTSPQTCRLPSCLAEVPVPIVYGDPTITGSGSTLFKQVDVTQGNYHLTSTDLSVDGKGPAFEFSRAYNSLALQPWTFGYEAKASFVEGSYQRQVTVGPREDGHMQFFFKDMDGLWYTLNPGNFDRLIENTDHSFVLYTQGNRLYRFEAPGSTEMGRLHSIEDRIGNALTFEYTNNTLVGANDANGRHYTIERDANNRIRRVTDFAGRYVEYSYDANGMLADVRNIRGGHHRYAYAGTTGNDRYLLASVTDPRGHLQLSIDYDDATPGRVVKLTDGVGAVTELSYPFIDTVGSPFYLKEATGIRQPEVNGVNSNVVFILDKQRTRVEARLDTVNAAEYVQTQGYQAAQDRQHLAETGLVVEVKDPKLNKTTIDYDDLARNRPAKITDAHYQDYLASYQFTGINLSVLKTAQRPGIPATQFDNFTPTGQAGTIADPRGYVTNRTFDAGENYWMKQETDPLGNVTSYSHDEFGHVTGTSEPLGRQTGRQFDALGRTTEEISPAGLHTLYTHDERGNVLSKTQNTDGIHYTTQYGYDESDNLLWTIGPRGLRTDYTYDALNRKQEERYTVGGIAHVRSYTYDAMGRLATVTNERGKQTTTHYDARSQVTERINPLQETTTYTYDANGNVASVTDGKGRTLTYNYDSLNRKFLERDAEGNEQVWTYYPSGQVKSHRDGRGNLTEYTYDASGNLIETLQGGGVTRATYDGNGNRLTVTDPNGHTTTYAFDALNRRVSTTLHDGRQWRYEYDVAGNLTSEVTPTGEKTLQTFDALGRVTQHIEYAANQSIVRQLSYGYDANGNVTSISSGGNTIRYTYDEIDRLASVTDQNGQTLSYAYDLTGNRTRLTYPGNKTVSYGYDAADRLQSLSDWLGRTTSYTRNQAGQVTDVLNGNGTKTHLAYDDAGRLIQLRNSKADGSVVSNHDLTLDDAGNIAQAAVILPLEPILPAGIGSLTYDTTNRLKTAAGKTYTHDDSGRIIEEDANGVQTIYRFDIKDHIGSIVRGSTTLSQYSYDPNDNRIGQIQNGVETRYVIDPLASLPNVVAETNAQGGVSRYYIYGEGLLSQIDAAGNSHYYHFDPTGHTLALTDASGNVTDRYAYTPYGNTTSQGITPNPFRFVGKYGVMDDGNGLHYMRARYYKQDIMRFVSLDALHGDLLTPQDLNRYAYVLGNPIGSIDPSGLTLEELYKYYKYIAEANRKMIEGSINYLANKIIFEPYQKAIEDCKNSNNRYNDGTYLGKANAYSSCYKTSMDHIVEAALNALSPTAILVSVLSVDVNSVTNDNEAAERYINNIELVISVISLADTAKNLQKQINQANGSIKAIRTILSKVNDKKGLAMVKHNLLIHIKELLSSLNDILDAIKRTTESA
jgi:RHS repeat-associated protein